MTTPTKVVGPQPRSSPAVSRDSHLTLRRVERQQRLVELLGSATQPVPTSVIATRLGAAIRTVERDLARLRESGVPIATTYGPHGGSHLPRFGEPLRMELTFPEAAALIASLTALGPTATESSQSAMQKLVQSISQPRRF